MASPIDLSKLETLVKSLNESLNSVGTRLTFATATVVLGLLIEYEEDARKVFWSIMNGVRNRNLVSFRALERHVKRAAFGGLLITVGVGAELWYEHRTSVIDSALQSANGQIVAFLNGKARDAELATQGLKTEADKAHAQAEGFKAKIAEDDARVKLAEGRVKIAESNVALATATVRTADARIAEAQRGAAQAQAQVAGAMAEAAKASLELVKLKSDRTLTAQQQDRIREKIKRFKGQAFDLWVTADGESARFMDLVDTMLRSAGWKSVPVKANLLYGKKAAIVAVTGFSLEIHESNRTDLEPAVIALRDAMIAEGIPTTAEANLDESKDKATIHVIVGSKPLN